MSERSTDLEDGGQRLVGLAVGRWRGLALLLLVVGSSTVDGGQLHLVCGGAAAIPVMVVWWMAEAAAVQAPSHVVKLIHGTKPPTGKSEGCRVV